jgi:hypothetical protein
MAKQLPPPPWETRPAAKHDWTALDAAIKSTRADTEAVRKDAPLVDKALRGRADDTTRARDALSDALPAGGGGTAEPSLAEIRAGLDRMKKAARREKWRARFRVLGLHVSLWLARRRLAVAQRVAAVRRRVRAALALARENPLEAAWRGTRWIVLGLVWAVTLGRVPRREGDRG